jgi:hypothetical protein
MLAVDGGGNVEDAGSTGVFQEAVGRVENRPSFSMLSKVTAFPRSVLCLKGIICVIRIHETPTVSSAETTKVR